VLEQAKQRRAGRATALAIYKAYWRHVDGEALTSDERALIDERVAHDGKGVHNVSRVPSDV
jgi:hypothetical protein